MRKITYKKLSIQNFLSIGNDSVVIDFKNGLNLITGNNIDNPERKNGTGKSSIIEGFYYVLFGKTIREIKKELIINNITNGKGNIELEFDVESDTGTKSYIIKRQLKPSKVELYEGDVDITRDSISNTDKFICDLIGSNPVLCKSCDILSLSDNIPFMAKTAQDKRKFIEDIFSLEIFGKMSKELKDLIRDNKTDIGISNTKFSEINNSLKLLEDQKESLYIKLKERETTLENRKKQLNQKIKDTQKEINGITIIDVSSIGEEIEKYNKAWESIDGKISKIITIISDIESNIRKIERDIDAASSVDDIKCYKCLQDIPPTHIEYLNDLKDSLNIQLDGLKESLKINKNEKNDWIDKKSKVQRKIASLTEQINKFKLDNQKIKSLKDILIEHKNALSDIEKDFTDSSETYDSFDKNIGETQQRIDKELNSLNSLKETSDELDTCKFILGEEGVKSFVIKKLLGMLNSGIQQYIIDLGMTMRCKFDEYFEEIITNEKGKSISYWNFSGGERRTVDLACAWAFKDMKRKISGVSSNLEFLDEIFDSAFDERGVDLLIEVIKNRIDKHNMSIYTISHRKETMRHIDNEVIVLEKENGVTKRVINND